MMNNLSAVFAYIGPETILPLSSLLAVIGGVLLFTWHWICAFCLKCARAMLGKSQPSPDSDK